MRHASFLFMLIFAITTFATIASEDLIKDCNGAQIGTNISLYKEYVVAKDGLAGRKFAIVIGVSDYYNTSAIIDAVAGNEFDVYIDDQALSCGKVKCDINGPQSCMLLDNSKLSAKQIYFSSGPHSITFAGKAPIVPQIAQIKLATSEKAAAVSASLFAQQAQTLALKTLPSNYDAIKTNGSMQLPTAAAMDQAEYGCYMNASFTYSAGFYFVLNAGTAYIFETRKADPCASDPVMYLFNVSDPGKGSWVDDDGNGCRQARISVTPTVKGTYQLQLRAFSSSNPGTSDLYKNGSLVYANAVLAGNMYYCGDVSKTGELNYFTCKPGTNPNLTDTWLHLTSGLVAPILASNNNGSSSSGEFYWGFWSRIKKSLPQQATYALITAGSNTSGTCDLYWKCDNSNLWMYTYPDGSKVFPNLKQNDAIASAPASSVYNCISWSGGISSEWIWPPSDPRWNTGGGDVVAFDNYYNNYPTLRYPGAISYSTRTSPSTAGVEIDLWASGSYPNYNYTHGSCMRPANAMTHGYDWESKPGEATRTFHPRNALSGPAYGNVVYSYKRSGALGAQMASTDAQEFAATPKTQSFGLNRPLSLDSSILLGLTSMRNVAFSANEKAKLASLKTSIPDSIKAMFQSFYIGWKTACADPKVSIFSNPSEYKKLAEYIRLRDFCYNSGKQIWSLLLEKADSESPQFPFIFALLADVLSNVSIAEQQQVNTEYAGNQYTSDGSFIYTTTKDRWVAVCKKLLANNF
jgi:hypothetical protein